MLEGKKNRKVRSTGLILKILFKTMLSRYFTTLILCSFISLFHINNDNLL